MVDESYESKLAKSVLSARQVEYLEWLMDPERQGSRKAWAEARGMAPKTLYNWMHDRWFNAAYEQRLAELNISPDRIQGVIDSLHKAAKAGDTKAASLYLQYVDRLNPKRIVIEDTRIVNMSDADLRNELEMLLGDNGVFED